jgi:hypothetical protein
MLPQATKQGGQLPYWPILALTKGHPDPTTIAFGLKEEACANFQYFIAQLP